MAVKGELLEEIQQLFSVSNFRNDGNGNVGVDCPFCGAQQRLSIDTKTGLWHCFVCEEKGLSLETLKKRLGLRTKLETAKVQIGLWAAELLASPDLLAYLRKERALLEETIQRYQLGVWLDGQGRHWLSIPVYVQDRLIGVRQWLFPFDRTPELPKIKWLFSPESVPLYLSPPEGECLILCEGELDALVLRQLGLPAVGVMSGASTQLLKYIDILHQYKQVYLCYDGDAVGQEFAEKAVRSIQPFVPLTRKVLLPEGMDATEFIRQFDDLDRAKGAFERLLEDAQSSQLLEGKTVPFYEFVQYKQPGKKMLVEASVQFVDKDKNQTKYPVYVPLMCSHIGKEEYCVECPIYQAADSGEPFSVMVQPDDPKVGEYLGLPLEKWMPYFLAKARIPILESGKRCPRAYTESTKVIEEDAVRFELKTIENEGKPNASRMMGWLTSAKAINAVRAGTRGKFEVVPFVSKDGAKADFTCAEVAPLDEDIDHFVMTQQIGELLKVFQVKEHTTQALKQKIQEIESALTKNAWHLPGAEKLAEAYDLVFHSVLAFPRVGDPAKTVRGWLEALVLGNSGVGKTSLAREMIQYYGQGELMDAQGATVPGLLAAAVPVKNVGYVNRPGLLPLMDRRLVILDEANKLDSAVFSELNAALSEGAVKRTTAAGTYQEDARVRLLWLTNPRDGSTLFDPEDPNAPKNHGDYITQLIELMNDDASVDRLDFAVGAYGADLPADTESTRTDDDLVYTKVLSRKLLLWAWTRRPEHVIWLDGSLQASGIAKAKLLKRFYAPGSRIRLVQPTPRTTERIWRIAVAAAALTFNTDSDFQKVYVGPEHIEYALDFLTRMFQTLGYADYIIHLKQENTRNPSSVVQMVQQLLAEPPEIQPEDRPETYQTAHMRLSDVDHLKRRKDWPQIERLLKALFNRELPSREALLRIQEAGDTGIDTQSIVFRAHKEVYTQMQDLGLATAKFDRTSKRSYLSLTNEGKAAIAYFKQGV